MFQRELLRNYGDYIFHSCKMVKQSRKTIYVTDKRVQHEEKQLYAYCKITKDVNRVNRCVRVDSIRVQRCT